ncbi:hypothetical protein BpHYR1_016238 [Brachionus plicatilis]|uniref:Uncharacterized protein n=1 Tax=Brachionus plicatilis TaxID=10195 RepID=A0A3M7RIB9_BRAPC|nr:hypothetical protein BpHYR1_016238 [Brachionus plicatilis]
MEAKNSPNLVIFYFQKKLCTSGIAIIPNFFKAAVKKICVFKTPNIQGHYIITKKMRRKYFLALDRKKKSLMIDKFSLIKLDQIIKITNLRLTDRRVNQSVWQVLIQQMFKGYFQQIDPIIQANNFTKVVYLDLQSIKLLTATFLIK